MKETTVLCSNGRCVYNDNMCSAYYGVCSNKSMTLATPTVDRIYAESCKFAEQDSDPDTHAISILVC